MLKKLAEKDLVNYIKYQGVSLTEQGNFRPRWSLENTDYEVFWSKN
jgi:Mn-dependent DtxR family transcriptional regulator